ncbi:protein kinase domain-containing protein [Anaerobutyricum hallii]|jgi:serine/threonine protein kinase|uniref:protein kinase domain-containing protein n=1 Tax=Anaerobutyricum hallii TaxID=39488 RepID=UPI003AB53FB4
MEENLYCLRKGTRLIGRYTVEGVLGQGGFGITYLGMDELHKKKVAIKEFFPQGIVTRNIEYEDTVTVTLVGEKENYDKGKERFLKEAQTMAMFSKDKGIVKALDFFEINNTAYIVMEYLEGVTLKQYLRENKRIVAEDLVELLVPLIEALDEIHSQGLIHRDISPDNIMVLPDGRIKLMDFGAARDYTEFGEKSLSIVLKPGYAPPEQYQTHGVQGPWTDIYALCATMYKCITGENPPDAIDRLVDDHLKKISAFRIPVLPQIEEAIIKGMSVAAKDRYQNVGDFCEDLYGGYEENSEPEAEESQAEPVVAEANVETKMDMLTEESPQSKYPTTEAVQEREKLISKELSENAGLTSEENVAKAGIETDKNDAGNKVPEQSPEKEKVSITPEKEGIPDNRGKEETKKIQKKNKYFLPIIGILILLGIAGAFAYNKSVSKKGTIAKVESSSQKKDKNPDYKVGETIEFGNYPQEEDGTEKPIEWIVMKNEGNQVLLLSKYVLDVKPYNEESKAVTWETSDIRKWLNNEFYTTAFNKAEKAKIRTSLIKNEDNSMYGTSGGNDTEDKVFLLSEKEAETLFSNDDERIAKATGYAEKSGVYVNEEKAAWWWLRSPGDDSGSAAKVDNDGWVNRNGYDVDSRNDGVRPALHLNLQS